jgi:uncharacterized membrane protein
MGEPKGGKTSMGLEPNIAGLLCYVLGWVTGIVFFIMEKDNKLVRFHAMQSIITFGILFLASIILSFIPFVGWFFGVLLSILTFVLWVVLMLKAYQEVMFKLPIVGDIAEKQVK